MTVKNLLTFDGPVLFVIPGLHFSCWPVFYQLFSCLNHSNHQFKLQKCL